MFTMRTFVLTVLAVTCLARPGVSAAASASPKAHRSGDEGYFSVTAPLPENAPAGYLILAARAASGDIYLINATLPWRADAQEQGREMIITGRYGKAGKATIEISGKPGFDQAAPFTHLATLSLDLPDTAPPDREVVKTWATYQRNKIRGGNYGGGDPFFSYWSAIAATRYGLAQESWDESRSWNRGTPDLYDIFTGAAAIQESLQLEVLGSRAVRPRTAPTVTQPGKPVASLAAPQVKSHPFADMLKGRSPKVPPLSAFIPADQYAVFIKDVNKQFELLDLMEEWGATLLESMQASSRDFKLRKKLARQLCLEPDLLSRLFGDRVIGAMAFTGNDPFLKEGSDLSVLFRLKDRELFLKQLDKRHREAASNYHAQREESFSNGQKLVAVTSPGGRISSHLTVIGDVAVVSNNRAALRRIIETATGKREPLAKALDFQYLRTIFPEGDENEDIFIYLSDAHIRSLVGPVSKISEARRMTCSTNLQVLANARLWYKAERRRDPSLRNLIDGGYLAEARLACPTGGAYSLDSGSGEPVCSHHNRIGYLTPIVSLQPGNATDLETLQYASFVENYNRYWSRFFDPIGIRIKMGEKIRIQTCILPLIENSWYDGLVALSGREAGPLPEASVLPGTIMSLRTRLAPELLQKTELVRSFSERWKIGTGWIGNELSLNLCDGPVLFTVEGRAGGFLGGNRGGASLEPLVFGYLLSAMNLPTYVSVKLTDPAQAERTLPRVFQSLLNEHGSREVMAETYALEPYRGKNISVFSFTLFIAKLRLYAVIIDDRLIIASRRDIVTDLIDHASDKPHTSTASMEFSLYRTAFRQIEPFVSIGYQEDIRHACKKNLALAETLLDIGKVASDDLRTAAFGLRGYELYCPAGGKYSLEEGTRRAYCSVHGKSFRQVQPAAAAENAPLIKLVNSLKKIDARLAFSEEGLMATVEIDRSEKK